MNKYMPYKNPFSVVDLKSKENKGSMVHIFAMVSTFPVTKNGIHRCLLTFTPISIAYAVVCSSF